MSNSLSNLDHHQNVIISSLAHYQPFLWISLKSILNFLSYFAKSQINVTQPPPLVEVIKDKQLIWNWKNKYSKKETLQVYRFGESYIPVAIGWKKTWCGISGRKPPRIWQVGPHAGERDSFTLLSLPDKRVVLKPPRSSLKHFLTHGHVTAHAKTHIHTQNIISMGTTRIKMWKKASYGCCHLSEGKKNLH